MSTPSRSNWQFVPFKEWASNPNNLFLPHSSRVNYAEDQKVIKDIIPDYEKPVTRPPFDLGN